MGPVYLLFLLSGAAGLLYQVIWSRLLHEIFGVTAYAITTVLATFLGGLALGSFLIGRWADRRPDPLRFYGWLEIGIGLAALGGSWVVGLFEPLHISAANRFAPDSAVLIGVRVLLASIVILPPTFLMGGTLPVVARVVVDGRLRLGRVLSQLYAINTLGAVIGSLAAGFVLIRLVGVHATLWIAVAVNVVVGVGALFLARGSSVARVRREVTRVADVAPIERPRSLLAMMALSGFVALGLEVIWTRVLVLIVGTTTYAFVTMLSAFLIGITLGSLVARLFVDRVSDLRRAFGWIQLGIALTVLATIPVMAAVLGPAQGWHGTLENRWLALIAVRFGVSFLIMLVPTVLIGMTFPVAGRLWTRGMDGLSGELGEVYGANTAGNILGAAITGFVLLPAIGMQQGVVALAILSLVSAAWGLVPIVGEGRRLRWRAAPLVGALTACVVALALWHPPPFRTRDERAGDPVLFYKEGVVATVKVVQRAHDGTQRWMAVDGIKIGESHVGVDKKQQLLAHLPFLLGSASPPRDVLSIGLGTGILIGEVVRHPGVRHVDCLEISPAVIEAARYFDDENGHVLDHPAVRIINDDGVNFLRRSSTSYDAIISDGKSRTAHAGNALFYSEDYYRLCREHLAADGIMLQWVPLDLPPGELRIVLRTFLGVFPQVYVWFAHQSCFLVGMEAPLTIDVARVQETLDSGATTDLRLFGWNDAYGLIGLLGADRGSLAGWVGEAGTVNSLERPVLEFYSPRAYAEPESARRAANLAAIHRAHRTPPASVTLVGADPARVHASRAAAGWLIEGLMLLERGGGTDVDRGVDLLDAALVATPGSGVLRHAAGGAFFRLGVVRQAEGRIDEAIGCYRRSAGLQPRHAETHNNLGGALGELGRIREATTHFRAALQLNDAFGGAHNNLGNALVAQGRPDEAITHYRRALGIAPDLAKSHRNLGVALTMTGRSVEALDHFEQAVRLEPSWPGGLSAMGWFLAVHPDPAVRDGERAIELARRATNLSGRRDLKSMETLAAAYSATGEFDAAVQTGVAALALARNGGDPRRMQQAGDRLALYRQGIPLHQAMARRTSTR